MSLASPPHHLHVYNVSPCPPYQAFFSPILSHPIKSIIRSDSFIPIHSLSTELCSCFHFAPFKPAKITP
ncbi:hypothetical protein CGCVW01_v006128 [Colletotrichum viniferum]|nr:hypothetical protein CGCVW01_v006128 [Colletotrichum viniferum]